jgi:hypothetical protein
VVGSKKRFLAMLCVAVAGTAFAAADARADDPVNLTKPKISGTPVPGHTLTASPGTWRGQGEFGFAYAWLRCNAAGKACAPLKRAGKQVLGRKMIIPKGTTGTVRVSVLASDSGGTTAALSAPVKIRAH